VVADPLLFAAEATTEIFIFIVIIVIIEDSRYAKGVGSIEILRLLSLLPEDISRCTGEGITEHVVSSFFGVIEQSSDAVAV